MDNPEFFVGFDSEVGLPEVKVESEVELMEARNREVAEQEQRLVASAKKTKLLIEKQVKQKDNSSVADYTSPVSEVKTEELQNGISQLVITENVPIDTVHIISEAPVSDLISFDVDIDDVPNIPANVSVHDLDLESAFEEISKLKNDLTNKEKENEALQEELEKQKECESEMVQELNSTKRELEETRRQLQQRQDEFDAKIAEANNSSNMQLKNTNSVLKKMQDQLVTKEMQIETIQKELDEAKQKLITQFSVPHLMNDEIEDPSELSEHDIGNVSFGMENDGFSDFEEEASANEQQKESDTEATVVVTAGEVISDLQENDDISSENDTPSGVFHSAEENKDADNSTSNVRRQKSKPMAEKKTGRLVCQECQKFCRSKSALINHMRTHTGEKPYTCKKCPGKFSQNGSLKKHLIRVHSGKRLHSCDFCEQTFPLKFDRDRHVRTVHFNKLNFKCNSCEKKFSRRDNLYKHRRIHEDKKNIKDDKKDKKKK